MSSRLRLVLTALSAPVVVLAAVVVPAGGAGAATMVRECKVTGTSCVRFSGYAGKPVWGYPVSSKGTNCVNYVAYRLSRNGVRQQSTLGNGGSWAANAARRGITVDKTPRTGAVAQWNYGSRYAPANGHVGYVEEVTSSYIVISDTSYSGGYSSRWRVPKGDANWPSNFIHFKDTTYQPPPSGSYVRVRETGEVYRLVGRTPVYVSTWAGVGGTQPTHPVSSATLASLPATPVDGTFLRGGRTGEVYRVAGGAPIAVASWAAVGGAKPVTVVDQAAIDRAGSDRRFAHLSFRPKDGTYLQGYGSRRIYQVKGGVARWVTSWTQVGGRKPYVAVDQAAIDNAGKTSPLRWSHLAGSGVL